jgi:transcriptional regulator with XRE-family HTH domain
MNTRDQQWVVKPTCKLSMRAGRWLRALRERRGFTQRELAVKVGLRHYSIIAQLEYGRGHIPPEHHAVRANALGVEPQQFARGLMSCYDAARQDVALPELVQPPTANAGNRRASYRSARVILPWSWHVVRGTFTFDPTKP